MMKAFIVDRYGSSDNVRAAEMPDPEVRENDVLVQVRAAGVNVSIHGYRELESADGGQWR